MPSTSNHKHHQNTEGNSPQQPPAFAITIACLHGGSQMPTTLWMGGKQAGWVSIGAMASSSKEGLLFV